MPIYSQMPDSHGALHYNLVPSSKKAGKVYATNDAVNRAPKRCSRFSMYLSMRMDPLALQDYRTRLIQSPLAFLKRHELNQRHTTRQQPTLNIFV